MAQEGGDWARGGEQLRTEGVCAWSEVSGCVIMKGYVLQVRLGNDAFKASAVSLTAMITSPRYLHVDICTYTWGLSLLRETN